MLVNLARNWYAPLPTGNVLFESKHNPIEIDDDFDETLLPSTARIVEGEGKKRKTRAPERAVLLNKGMLSGAATFYAEPEVLAMMKELESVKLELARLKGDPTTQVVNAVPAAEPVVSTTPEPTVKKTGDESDPQFATRKAEFEAAKKKAADDEAAAAKGAKGLTSPSKGG